MDLDIKKQRQREVTVTGIFSEKYYSGQGYGKGDAKRKSEGSAVTFRVDGDKLTAGMRNLAIDGFDMETLRNLAKIFTKLADIMEEVDT